MTSYVKTSAGELLMSEEVMDELGLTEGQWIDNKMFWQAIQLNAIHNIAQCKAKLGQLS